MNLVNYFDNYNCDKGSLKHRYDRVYEPALESLRYEKFTLLEIGVFKGNSLEAWVDYFPNATFVGVDIFVRVEPEKIPILNHPRVKWLRCDSLNGPTDDLIKLAESGFDVIIDDGLHTHDAQRLTFQHFIPLLKNGGVYFIEDVWPFNLMTEEEKEHFWLKRHSADFSDSQYSQLLNAISPYKTTFHDLRLGFDPDTFIIEVRK